MTRNCFFILLATLCVVGALVAAETGEPVSAPEPAVVDEAAPAVDVPLLPQPAIFAMLRPAGYCPPVCTNCTSHQDCFFICGGSASCFPDMNEHCGPPDRYVCYCD